VSRASWGGLWGRGWLGLRGDFSTTTIPRGCMLATAAAIGSRTMLSLSVAGSKGQARERDLPETGKTTKHAAHDTAVEQGHGLACYDAGEDDRQDMPTRHMHAKETSETYI